MPVPHSPKNRHVIPQNINPAGTRCVPVSIPDDPEWVAMFYDALARLGNVTRYVPDPDAQTIANRWKRVLYEVGNTIGADEDCSDVQTCEDGACSQIGAFHPALTYYPNNPITQPNYEGPFVDPVWGTGAGYIGATGSDAMIDVLAMAGQSLETLLAGGIAPSITLAFNGAGEIDVQFLATIQGGLVWGFPDGNPLLGDLVNLQYADILDLAGVSTLIDIFEVVIQQDQEAFVITHSWKFETAGDHTLTLMFIPSIEVTPPYLGVGGGLRNIQLCGNATVSEEAVTAYTIELDGDSLNLLADGVPVSEIPKTTLQTFLDKWVDNTGDTMSGVLDMRQSPDIYGYTQPILFRRNVTPHAYFQTDANTLALVSSPGLSRIQINNTNGTTADFSIETSVIRQRIGGSAYPAAGAWQVSFNKNASLGLGLRQHQSGQDYIRLYDAGNLARIAMAYDGGVQAAYQAMLAYSSTSQWREQARLSGYWIDDTDATRLGGAVLTHTSYMGTHEVMRAMYNEAGDNPTLRFFGGSGYGFRPAIATYHNGDELAAGMAEVLKQYHLIEDYTLLETPPEIEEIGLSALQKCNAAYYLADFIATVISDLFDNLYTVSYQEQVSGLIDGYGIPASIVIQLLAALEQTYTSATDINTDLSDPSVIADMLIAADFEKQSFYTAIEAYAWTEPLSVALLEQVLDGFWPNVGSLIAIGINTDQGACVDLNYPCGDVDINFRDGLSHNAVGLGTPTLGLGLKTGFDGTFYRAEVDVVFDEPCQFSGGAIDIDTGGATGWQKVAYERDGMGGWTQIFLELLSATSGLETLDMDDFNGLDVERIVLRTGSTYTDHSGRIAAFNLVSAG